MDKNAAALVKVGRARDMFKAFPKDIGIPGTTGRKPLSHVSVKLLSPAFPRIVPSRAHLALKSKCLVSQHSQSAMLGRT